MTTDGVALAGAHVSIHALVTPYARRTRLLSATPDAVPLASVQTDEEGSFSLASPKEPVVDLRVAMRGYEPFVRRVEREDEAVAIALRKTDMVKGSVTAGGKPVANALVVLGDDYVTRSDEQGRYEAPALELPYTIAVIHPDYAIDEQLLPTGAVPAKALNRTLSAGVTLTGRAVAANGTSPAPGAAIWVDDWPLAVSGADGAFTIAHAPADWTDLTARKGMLTGSHTAGGAKTITVRLEPSAVLSGRVRDAKTNALLAGATVGVWANLLRAGSAAITASAAITDAGGMYSIALPVGSSQLSSTHPSYAWDGDSIRMTPGQQRTKDFALTQLARVTGVVLDDAGHPVAAATVSPRDARNLGMPDMSANGATPVTAGPDGTFSVRVLPGHDFYLHVARKGLPQGRSEVMKLAAGERKNAVVLTLPVGIVVTGRALDASGHPLSGVSVVAGPGVGPGGVETLDTLFAPVEHDPVRSAADGTFMMRVKEGTYNFWFRRNGFLMQEVRAKRITATGENAIEARLDPAVEISGRVTRGGVGIADVEVAPEGGSWLGVTTASDGSFVLGGREPGATRLEFMKREELVDEKRTITAPEHGLEIYLRLGGTIRGRVVEKGTTTPIRSFRAGVMVGLGDMRSFSSEDGSFTLEHLPLGVMTVAVDALGHEGTSREVNVVRETVTDLVFELETGVRLTGKVTDANGAPLSGVSIVISPPRSMPGGMIGGTLGGVNWKPKPSRVANTNVTTVTDANGSYTIEGLTRGAESVQFSHPGHVQTTCNIALEGQEIKLDVQLPAAQP